MALHSFDAYAVSAGRLALGAVVLLALMAARGMRLPAGRVLWLHITVAALLANAVPYALFAVGERYGDSSLAGVVNASTPVWTAAIAYLAGLERDLGRRWLGIAVGFAGAVVITEPWRGAGGSPTPALLCFFGAAVAYGVSFVYMARYLTGRGIPAVSLSAAQLTASVPLACIPLLFTHAITVGPVTWRPVLSMLVLGALGTGVAYVINYALIEEGGAVAASVVTFLLPAVAIAAGVLFLHERPTLASLAGTVIVLAGVALSRRRPARNAS